METMFPPFLLNEVRYFSSQVVLLSECLSQMEAGIERLGRDDSIIGGLRARETDASDLMRRLAELADVTRPLIGPGSVRRRLPLAVGKLAWWPVRNWLSLKTEPC